MKAALSLSFNLVSTCQHRLLEANQIYMADLSHFFDKMEHKHIVFS